jgi:AraC family transcriptional regulator, regulatory protein of adaptative response / methylated-DNA-[protein]-cysteine methyltransferase
MPSVDIRSAWDAVLNHDRRFDGAFVYAVSSTQVYCRPSCPSRRPTRRQVTFFKSPQEAEAAGFRACLRCRPQSTVGSETEARVAGIRQYLDEHADELVTLRQLGKQAGMSPFHLQRTFTRIVGLSPKAYQDARRMERFTSSLKQGATVTHASYEAGFGSSSRLYERVNATLGMTPSALRSGGAGITLRYATVATPVGRLLVAMTERGVAAVSLGDTESSLVASLRQEFPKARLRRDPDGTRPHVRTMLQCMSGHGDLEHLPLEVNATAFQRKVWQALQRIPRGETRSYQEIARTIGQPAASRAVARACATNRIAVAIPCHRAIRGTGQLAGYRWGLERKKQLLELERA